ncbi:cell division protein FtsQ [Desulfotomaculum arcticum]|uniref:Cell division protein FtsQ n=1 Tax=Desulfotruncus arcticus DSM 17038 TaxID=1121424 RepID=A0A1I2QLC9_9FIRM|nr:cell division protein FtsQ [Desulfotomaculum arcticum] [Desulfotruncus arcticus DSM 17038]
MPYTNSKKRYIFWQSFFFIFIVLLAAYVLLQSPIFTISNIYVLGNNSLSAGDVIKVSGIVTGMNIFKADLNAAAGKIMAIPMVKDAQTIRKFPHTVVIEISERSPVALVLLEGRFVEVDAEGVYLRQGKAGTTGLPVITGGKLQVSGPGKPVQGTEFEKALKVVGQLPVELRQNLSEVNVGGDERVTLYTIEGTECKLGFAEDAGKKGNYILQVLQELKEQGKKIEYVDFSIANSPVVKYRN